MTIKLDKTPPAVTATAQRPPNAAGWYKDPVNVTFTASDATSKGEACEPPKTYSGPDSATASITGRCTDAAGNVGTRTRALRYDETAPRVRAVPGRRPDSYGWYGHDLRMTFVGADSISGIAQGSCTRKVYRGPNRAAASVTGKCTDKAGNTRFRAFSFKYQEPLLSPRNGRRVWRPLLNWVSVPNARYYNVQVWRSGQQIFNRWPVASQFRMPRTWVHDGVRYWMSSPGRYDWHVWPRFHGRYGKLVGHRYFIRR